MSSIKYRPEIDGLRAIAIVPVLLFHLNPKWLRGGFMGVDVFFVISGYLITSIILTELNDGTFTFRGFWERRVRRIFPALAVMVITVLVLAWFLQFPPKLLTSIGKQALTVAGTVSNYGMLHLTSDYWSTDADLIPLLHTWSLAIEEQFYLFLPAFLFLLFKFGKRSWACGVLIFLTIGSLLWCLKTSSQNDGGAFYLLPSRAWELFAGSILAFLSPSFFEKVPLNVSRHAANFGLILIGLAYLTIDEKGFPGWKAVVPVLGAFIFIGFSGQGGWASKLLALRPFVSVGKVSYSLYLWHWPALVFGKLFSDLFESTTIRWVAFLLSIFIAVGSYLLIESLGKKTKNIWKLSGSVFLILISLSIAIVFIPQKSGSKFYAKSSMNEFDAFNRRKNFAERDLTVSQNAGPAGKSYGEFSVTINPLAKPEIVVLGDSHGLHWGALIEKIAFKNNIACSFWTTHGVSPFLDDKSTPKWMNQSRRKEFNLQKINYIAQTKPRVVLVIARWDLCFARNELNRLENLISKIHQASPQSNIVILNQPPISAFGNQYAYEWMNWRAYFGLNVESAVESSSSHWSAANIYLQNLPQQYDYLLLINIDDLYRTQNGRVKLFANQQVVYLDDDHLSDYGVLMAEKRVISIVEPLLINSKNL